MPDRPSHPPGDTSPSETTTPTAAPRPRRTAVARGGVRPDERALAPDLARGMMLLLIVLSNTGFYLYATEHGPSGWHPVAGSALDSAAQLAMITGLDLRVYPMFAFLFGYGMMRLFQRQTEAGTTERGAVALLRRRSLWLIVIGFAHAGLLMAGDIIGTYGLISLVFGWLLLRRGNRTLLVAAGVFATLLLLSTALVILDYLANGASATTETVPSTVAYASGEESYLAAAVTRLTTWSIGVVLFGSLFSFAFHAAILLGFWAARHRVLEEPHRHLKLLWATAVAGIGIGWLGGLPVALAHVGVLDIPPTALDPEGPVFMWQALTGLPGGLGYAALFGLVAHWLSERARTSVPVVAVAAVGKRSLSSYLAHSLLFSPILAAWGLGLGAHLHSASMALFAFGVWLVTVVGAYALERAGRRGPAEALLRRLVYGRADQGNAGNDAATGVAGYRR